ncbi:hypothetical protein QN277_014641 [Acacia crassicarpa]|uniref:Uncharacterized protein n=1 Tax=Acacia crassicarpa TaxID=499986 RepID=A0AAE1KKV3_9FABA|nr:hypothetical protein QN277_014641 [Acacia crassicarpa]
MHNQSGELFPLWNCEFVFSFYAPYVAQQIISTPISFLNTSDRIVWTGNASGNYQITFDAELQVAKGDHDVMHSSSTLRISHDGCRPVGQSFSTNSIFYPDMKGGSVIKVNLSKLSNFLDC